MGAATILKKNQKIRTLSIIFLVIGLVTSTAIALDPMGPPVARLTAGQVQIGLDYSHSTMDLELGDGTWVESLDGALFDTGEAVHFTLKNFKAYRTYANIGLGATDSLEAFLRVGGTEGQFGDSVWEDQEEFEGGTDFAIGAGIKATFFDDGALQVGGLLQTNWAEYNGTLFASHWFAADRVEMNITEVQMAVGAAYTWDERFSIYGGPFLHFVSGDLDDTFSDVDTTTGGLLTSTYSWEIDEDAVFGGYFGAQLELTENCSFNIEYQSTGAADAVGMSLLWKN